jgi:hypothetical protein
MNRRKLYTEHKYVSFRLSEFSRFIAKTDFSDNHSVEAVMSKFREIKELMHGHAGHENNTIHPLLKEKGSALAEKIENEHHEHDSIFKYMDELLTSIKSSLDDDVRIQSGHEYYLAFLRFEASNLQHQEYEEKIILPELHQLYSDNEILSKVDGPVYAVLAVDHMIGMLKELFPHFNREDKFGMLSDIQLAQPDKFSELWKESRSFLEENDHAYLALKFGTPVTE